MAGVGKTCLLMRVANGEFPKNSIRTIGIDFKIKNVMVNDKKVKLQIWDSPGAERFRSMVWDYLRGAQGIVICYDTTDKSTFDSVRTWHNEVKERCDININIILVACKSDVQTVPTNGSSYGKVCFFFDDYRCQFCVF